MCFVLAGVVGVVAGIALDEIGGGRRDLSWGAGGGFALLACSC